MESEREREMVSGKAIAISFRCLQLKVKVIAMTAVHSFFTSTKSRISSKVAKNVSQHF